MPQWVNAKFVIFVFNKLVNTNLMKTVFECDGYRQLLRESFPGKGEARGRRKLLAEHLGCQTSFLSLVLTEKNHMSEEMFLETCQFLKFQKPEIEFALLLYHFERASSQSLRDYYQNAIQQSLQELTKVDQMLKQEERLSPQLTMKYYSSWIYQAIHIASTLQKGVALHELAELFALKEERLQEPVEFLLKHHLIKKSQGRYMAGVQRIHLSRQSPLAALSHSSWRAESLRQMAFPQKDHLHFSSIYSLAKSDYKKIKKLIEDAILATDALVTPSPEEELCFLGVDLYRYSLHD